MNNFAAVLDKNISPSDEEIIKVIGLEAKIRTVSGVAPHISLDPTVQVNDNLYLIIGPSYPIDLAVRTVDTLGKEGIRAKYQIYVPNPK